MKTFIVLLLLAVGGGVGFKYQDKIFEIFKEGEIIAGSAEGPVVVDHFKKARKAVADDDFVAAKGYYEELIARPETSATAVNELVALYLKKKKNAAAYTLQYESSKDEKTRAEALKKIREIKARTMNAGERDFNGKRYIIKSGDTLAKIAKKHNSTPLLLKFINKIDNPAKIRAGQAIKIVETEPFIVVKISERKLYHYQKGNLFEVYSVGVGKKTTPTPTREFEITVMQIDPPWYKELGKAPVRGGSKENALGSRWMGFEGEYTSFGIHGTNEPKSVGSPSSNGCVRMVNKDVNELFLFCKIGTKVKIVK